MDQEEIRKKVAEIIAEILDRAVFGIMELLTDEYRNADLLQLFDMTRDDLLEIVWRLKNELDIDVYHIHNQSWLKPLSSGDFLNAIEVAVQQPTVAADSGLAPGLGDEYLKTIGAVI